MPSLSLYIILEMFTVFSVLVDSSPVRPPLMPIVALGAIRRVILSLKLSSLLSKLLPQNCIEESTVAVCQVSEFT
jgi:hypothetical protein